MNEFITQMSRIQLHTINSTASFTLPPTDESFNGWIETDLLQSEIGVNENDKSVWIRIGNDILPIGGTSLIGGLQGVLDVGNTFSGTIEVKEFGAIGINIPSFEDEPEEDTSIVLFGPDVFNGGNGDSIQTNLNILTYKIPTEDRGYRILGRAHGDYYESILTATSSYVPNITDIITGEDLNSTSAYTKTITTDQLEESIVNVTNNEAFQYLNVKSVNFPSFDIFASFSVATSSGGFDTYNSFYQDSNMSYSNFTYRVGSTYRIGSKVMTGFDEESATQSNILITPDNIYFLTRNSIGSGSEALKLTYGEVIIGSNFTLKNYDGNYYLKSNYELEVNGLVDMIDGTASVSYTDLELNDLVFVTAQEQLDVPLSVIKTTGVGFDIVSSGAPIGTYKIGYRIVKSIDIT